MLRKKEKVKKEEKEIVSENTVTYVPPKKGTGVCNSDVVITGK